MLAVFSQAPEVDEYVIYINDDETVKELPEYLMHEILKDRRGIDKAIRHYPIFIVVSRAHKSCLTFISLAYSDEVICAAEI